MFTFHNVRPHRPRPVLRCGIERLEGRCLLQATAAQYTQVNLVSDGTIPAAFTDTNLVNAWGLAASPTGPFWVANNGTGTATLYNGHGVAQSLVVTIPAPPGSTEGAAPTGEVFNGTTAFAVSANGQAAPAIFLFASERGTITGWNPNVDATNAVIAVDNSASGAIYKGLATATADGAPRLYATDFHNAKVDVFDANFSPVTTSGGFTDSRLPKGFAPFGIASINGQIYVSYAKQDAAAEDDAAGRGRGFVDVFSTDGVLVKRLISHGRLNSPWGMTVAPANFGAFSNDLLVGNFGDGTINVFNSTTGKSLGTLKDSGNRQIKIDGLWSLVFGNGGNAGATNTLFFTAGPDGETHGLFGLIGANNPTGTTTGSTGSAGTTGTATSGVNPGLVNPAVNPGSTPALTDTASVQGSGVVAGTQTDMLAGMNGSLFG